MYQNQRKNSRYFKKHPEDSKNRVVYPVEILGSNEKLFFIVPREYHGKIIRAIKFLQKGQYETKDGITEYAVEATFRDGSKEVVPVEPAPRMKIYDKLNRKSSGVDVSG